MRPLSKDNRTFQVSKVPKNSDDLDGEEEEEEKVIRDIEGQVSNYRQGTL